MDDARWDALVRRLEPLARSNPAGYRRKVLLLAALGYAFIGALLAVLLGCAVLVVVLALKSSALLLKLLIPVGALFWVTLRSLYVRFEPPNGFPLKRQDAPALFAMIGDVRKAVRGPKVHQVVVDGEPNAGVVQVPRAGGIFGSRNYLVLGLPYLEALSAEVIPKSGFRKAWREAGDDVEPLEQRVANDLRLPQDVIVVTCGRESPLAEHLAAVPGSRIV